MPPDAPRIRRIDTADDAVLEQLAALLIDCVAGGASVSFMHPLPHDRALAFWRGVAQGAAAGERVLLVADTGHRIVGTVQVIVAQPENQPHRADVAKMLVRRDARRHGIGAALMRAAEEAAAAAGKTLLLLDTASDEAARLYARLGWQRCGHVPGYALWPDGGRCDTVFFYRELPAPAGHPFAGTATQ